LPIKSLSRAGYTLDDLEPTGVVICGYDSNGNPALGTIILKLQMSTFCFKVKFFVIEFTTSYSALLERPWLPKYHVVPSTLHQCLKFVDNQGEQQRIIGNLHPYTLQEVHHADAKYFFPNEGVVKQLGRSTPPAEILITPKTTPSVAELKYLIAPCVASSKPRNSSYQEHGRKSSGHLAKGTTPCVEVEKQELKSPSQLWT
jgi:hypothetical protein